MEGNKGLMALGAGVLGLGAFLLFRKKAEAAPPLPEGSPENTVGIMLRNPPSGATMWSIKLSDWDRITPLPWINAEDRLTFEGQALFEIPDGITFPLRIMALQITRWNEAGTALIVLYEIQSFRPFMWDWDLSQYGDDPDPSYRDVFIPAYGSYYYNVSKEKFEQ